MQLLTDKDLGEFLAEQESQYIEQASFWRQCVVDRFENGKRIYGDKLPWSKTHAYVRLRPGELSIWGGYNGAGKSMLLSQVCAWGLRESRWCIASMEMLPEATMYRMCRQVSGNVQPSVGYLNQFMTWTDGRLWIYDQTDTVPKERIAAMLLYCARKLKMNHIVIDSLIKCGIPREDYEKQAAFVDRLCWIAKTEKVHIHLVHHMRKGENELKRPGKYDLRGAGELSDLVDNVFIVHRNKSKELTMKNPTAPLDKIEKAKQEPDQILAIEKQRHGEWEGSFCFWFHEDSMQYTPTIDNRPFVLDMSGN